MRYSDISDQEDTITQKQNEIIKDLANVSYSPYYLTWQLALPEPKTLTTPNKKTVPGNKIFYFIKNGRVFEYIDAPEDCLEGTYDSILGKGLPLKLAPAGMVDQVQNLQDELKQEVETTLREFNFLWEAMVVQKTTIESAMNYVAKLNTPLIDLTVIENGQSSTQQQCDVSVDSLFKASSLAAINVQEDLNPVSNSLKRLAYHLANRLAMQKQDMQSKEVELMALIASYSQKSLLNQIALLNAQNEYENDQQAYFEATESKS